MHQTADKCYGFLQISVTQLHFVCAIDAYVNHISETQCTQTALTSRNTSEPLQRLSTLYGALQNQCHIIIIIVIHQQP